MVFSPYRTAIENINKIEYEMIPRDKFDVLMKANLELKTCILDLTNGTLELNSMDDELPLFIYIVTQVSLKNIFAEYCIIEDYLKYSRNCIDKESKVLTNLKVG